MQRGREAWVVAVMVLVFVAATVYYLCSDEAGYVTGSEIFVTGGQHLF